MRTFKVIKTWPGSPPLGTEYTHAKQYDHYNYNGGSFDTSITEEDILFNKDFFEEIVEKEYEILAFKNDKGLIKQLGKDGLYHWVFSAPTTLEFELNSSKTIYSVKRLSDGEVFTIGDIVNGAYCENRPITCFKFISDAIHIGTGQGFIRIASASKVKQPLFTTEDGVDIYEGDEFFRVFKKNWQLYDLKAFASKDYLFERFKSVNLVAWHFSTEKAAEEYILMNKPCLSINDILKITDDITGLFNVSELENLAKKKSNL